MKNIVLGLFLLFAGYAAAGPLDKAVDIVRPELYSVSIYLKGGEVVKVEKVAFTEWSLKKRFTINASTKTLKVIPQGDDKLRVIPTADIEKIEMTRAKDEPAPVPTPPSVG